MMKKKSLYLVISFLFVANSWAKTEFFCGYKDYFHISSKSHPAIYIANATSDGDIMLQSLGPRSFIIRDTPRCENGFAHVTLVLDQNNWCVLDIKDGPYMWSPTLHASCHGLIYKGMTYDGFRTRSYTIHFE